MSDWTSANCCPVPLHQIEHKQGCRYALIKLERRPIAGGDFVYRARCEGCDASISVTRELAEKWPTCIYWDAQAVTQACNLGAMIDAKAAWGEMRDLLHLPSTDDDRSVVIAEIAHLKAQAQKYEDLCE